jgi:hypothetical protein
MNAKAKSIGMSNLGTVLRSLGEQHQGGEDRGSHAHEQVVLAFKLNNSYMNIEYSYTNYSQKFIFISYIFKVDIKIVIW